MKITSMTLAIGMLTACGEPQKGDPGKNGLDGKDAHAILYVDSTTTFSCTQAREKTIVFGNKEQTLFLCKNLEWSPIFKERKEILKGKWKSAPQKGLNSKIDLDIQDKQLKFTIFDHDQTLTLSKIPAHFETNSIYMEDDTFTNYFYYKDQLFISTSTSFLTRHLSIDAPEFIKFSRQI